MAHGGRVQLSVRSGSLFCPCTVSILMGPPSSSTTCSSMVYGRFGHGSRNCVGLVDDSILRYGIVQGTPLLGDLEEYRWTTSSCRLFHSCLDISASFSALGGALFIVVHGDYMPEIEATCADPSVPVVAQHVAPFDASMSVSSDVDS